MSQYLMTLTDDGTLIVWTPALVVPPAERKKFSQDIGSALQKATDMPPIVRPHVVRDGE